MDRGPGMVPEGCGPSRLQAPPPPSQAGWSRGSAHRNHGEEVPKRGLALTRCRARGGARAWGASLDLPWARSVMRTSPALFEFLSPSLAVGWVASRRGSRSSACGGGRVASACGADAVDVGEQCKAKAFNLRSAISLRFARLVT